MAQQKSIFDLDPLAGTSADDLVYVADVSDTADSPNGSARKVKLADLLPGSGVAAGTYGSASAIPSFTVDAKGRVTSATANPFSGLSASALASLVAAAPSPAVPSAQSYLLGIDNAGALAKYRPDGAYVLASSFGQPTGTNDTATLQAAATAAIASGRALMLDNPAGTPARWKIGGTLNDVAGAKQVPRVNSINTSTGVLTFDRAHLLQDGDVVAFVGSDVGGGGGTTQIRANAEYFFRSASPTTGTLYTTRAQALAGGATGLMLPATGIVTTGTLNTLTTASTLSNGNTTVTVSDASKVANGDFINFGGSGSSAFYKVTNVAGNVVTFQAVTGGGGYSGSLASGATAWLSSIDVASTLSIENGTTFALTGPGTFNSVNSVFTVTQVTGQTVHFNNPPNASLPTPGASQNLVMNLWLDAAYLRLCLELCGAPGASLEKAAGFSGTLFQAFYGTKVYIHDLEFDGATVGYTADPGIVNGDDGIRVLGSNGAYVERCTFRNFGDATLRFHTSSYFAAARSATYPRAGVYSNNIVVRDCQFHNCFQLSTTNSNTDYQGGSRNVWYVNNVFRGIGGSVKFANRAPGSENIHIVDNTFDVAGRNGLELDSCDNFYISGNTFNNFKRWGVFFIANNLQPIGFEYNQFTCINNRFFAGPNTAGSASGGVHLNHDAYPDNTRWDFKGTTIAGNRFYDLPAGAAPIQVNGGSYADLRIQDNLFYNCAHTRMIDLNPRASTTPGFRNDFLIAGNIGKKCPGAKATFIYLVPNNGAAGGPYIRGVTIAGNHFDSSDVTLAGDNSNDGRYVWMDFVRDVRIRDNEFSGYAGPGAIYVQSEGKDISVTGNTLANAHPTWSNLLFLNGVDGIYVRDNEVRATAAGTWATFDRRCQRVRIRPNDVAGSAAKTISVGNIPVKTSGDGLRREEYVASAPSSGTYDAGDRFFYLAPASGTSLGGVYTAGGTHSGIAATADSTSGSATLTNLSNFNGISVGAYVTHPGFTGTRKVAAMTAATVTLDANAASDQAAGSLAHAAPTVKAMPSIA